MDEFGDEASAILMMSHAPRAHEVRQGPPTVQSGGAFKPSRPPQRAGANPASEARRASTKALKAGQQKANAIRRKAAADIEAAKRKEAAAAVRARELEAKLEEEMAAPAPAPSPSPPRPAAAALPAAPLYSAGPQHEPIFPPTANSEVRNEAAKSLVKRLRGEVRERAKRKKMAAEAEAAAIRVEMEELDKLKAAREAAEVNKREAHKAERLHKAAQRRREVQARLRALNRNKRRQVPASAAHLPTSSPRARLPNAAAPSRASRPPRNTPKWEWRPPAPVLPAGDPMSGGLAVAGMQVSGVSQSLLAQAAAVDSAVPALDARKASLAALRANFDAATPPAHAAVSTPGSYYAPQLFGGMPPGSARYSEASSDGTKSRSTYSPARSPDMQFAGGYVFDADLPPSTSPSTKATPRMRSFQDAPAARPQQGQPSRLLPGSRGSARSRLSPLQQPATAAPVPLRAGSSPARMTPSPHHAAPPTSLSPLHDAGDVALDALGSLATTAAEAAAAAALEAEAAAQDARNKPLKGRGKRPSLTTGASPPNASLAKPVVSPVQSPARKAALSPLEKVRPSPVASPSASRATAGWGQKLDGWGDGESEDELATTLVGCQEHTPDAGEGDTSPWGHSAHAKHSLGGGPHDDAASPEPNHDSSSEAEELPDAQLSRSSTGESKATDSAQHAKTDATPPQTDRHRQQDSPPAPVQTGESPLHDAALTEQDVTHLSKRLAGQAPIAAGGRKAGPSLNRLYAAAAAMADEESEEEDITPDVIAARMQAAAEAHGDDPFAGMSQEEAEEAKEAQARKARDIARNVDFLKVLAGEKRKLASWNHAGEPDKPVEAFTGSGQALGTMAQHTAAKQASAAEKAAAAKQRAAQARAARAQYFERSQAADTVAQAAPADSSAAPYAAAEAQEELTHDGTPPPAAARQHDAAAKRAARLKALEARLG